MAQGFTKAPRVRARKKLDVLLRRHIDALRTESTTRSVELFKRVLSRVEDKTGAAHRPG
jgi:hypothetical protein